MDLIAFYILAVAMALAALFAVLSANKVNAAAWFALVFASSAPLLMLIGAEYLAVLQLLIGVGGVSLLFWAVAFAMKPAASTRRHKILVYLPLGALTGVLLFAELMLVAFDTSSGDGRERASSRMSNAEEIGFAMYADYVFVAPLLGVLLLVALMGAGLMMVPLWRDEHQHRVSKSDIAPDSAIPQRQRERQQEI